MHHLVGHALTDMAAALVTPLAALGYLLWVDWRLTLVTLIPVVLFVVAHAVMMRGFGEHMDRYNEAMTRVNAAVVEFVQGIAVVKTFGQTRRAHDRFRRASDDFADFWWQWVRPMLRLSSVSQAAVAPPTVLVVVLGAGIVFVAQGWAEPVDVVPFALLGLALAAPLLTLEYGSMDLKLASAAAGRVAALLHTPALAEPTTPRQPRGHRVEFDGVAFSYDGQARVLRGIDAVLEPGTVTALVGPSGSGKSTLARLLPRFWDVDEGAVRIGGVDVREIGSIELYRHVGFVFQDVQLLRTSIHDNIALARPDATADEVAHAAGAAQIHERIEQLPRGYDSVVGEDAHLSAGEAQRVSIARALLADTPILVLDEATAFADPESEAAIQDALSALVAGRTLLVIAHRLHTVVHADQILVLSGGEIVERGRHPELAAAGGTYARMWAAQERSTTRDWAHDEPRGRTVSREDIR
ncbi:ABC transporter ATP-binding protein [Streptomyces sp. NPDC050211]|uniref:ABC transporter ATP-binding protein n=1 Tax=Streptomyces sp. NPDC050211 TaxID=3154932 RepID=UPI0034481BB7